MRGEFLPQTGGWMFIGDLAGDCQLHFGSSLGAAEEFKTGIDEFGALTHPDNPPVTLASGTKNLRVDAFAVVANEDVKISGVVLDLDLDAGGAGVKEGVDDSLAGDTASLVADGWMQGAGLSLNDDAEGGMGAGGQRGGKLLRDTRQEL